MYAKSRCTFWLLGTIATLVVCLLTACNMGASNSQTGDGDRPPSSTPAIQKDAHASPTVQRTSSSPLPTTPQTNTIHVTTSKLSYSNKDMIMVTITNNSAHNIYFSPYYTNCTPVQLQTQGQTGWALVGSCPERTQTTQVLQPGASMIFQLRPTARGGFRPGPVEAWSSGIYRIFFSYTVEPDPDTAHHNLSLSSTEFVVHP